MGLSGFGPRDEAAVSEPLPRGLPVSVCPGEVSSNGTEGGRRRHRHAGRPAVTRVRINASLDPVRRPNRHGLESARLKLASPNTVPVPAEQRTRPGNVLM
jgi:hypothetical protein